MNKLSTRMDLIADSTTGKLLWRRYGSEEKLENAERLCQLTQDCAEDVDAFPWRITLEPCNVCNLTCCREALRASALPYGYLKEEDLEHFLRDLWPRLVQINLFNWGEPFLNEELPAIIRLIHSHAVGTQIHSNMNVVSQEQAEAVSAAGLDVLVASIDGVTQDVYERYRSGGNVGMALANLRTMAMVRDRGCSDLRLVWRSAIRLMN